MSVNGNFGIRRLLDQQLRFMKPGPDTWLRVKNFNDVGQDYAEMGFAFVPSASGAQTPLGYTDLKIWPQPVVRLMSMHNVAQAQAAGMSLREGSRIVMVSHTWVSKRQAEMGYSNPRQVFEDPSVIGLVTENVIVSIESLMPDYAYGVYTSWHIQGNSNELQ